MKDDLLSLALRADDITRRIGDLPTSEEDAGMREVWRRTAVDHLELALQAFNMALTQTPRAQKRR